MKSNKLVVFFQVFAALFIFSISSTGQESLSEEWEMGYLRRQPPDKIMNVIGVKPGMTIGEVGAGRGRFTVYLAKEVGTSGKIYANDIDEKALSYLKGRAFRQGFRNIDIIIGKQDDPRFLDNSLDMAIMVLVYHMLDNPDNLLKNIKSGLKPGSNLVIIDPVDKLIDEEFGVDRTKPGAQPPTIKERIEKSAKNAGYELIKIETFLPDDCIYILRPNTWDKKKSGAEIIRTKILLSGLEEGRKQFENIKNDTLNYNLSESNFINLGYEFYGKRTFPEAIEVLNMGISLYPESWELHNTLGEFYLVSGNKEMAKKSFEISVKYNPENETGQYVLKNLDSLYDEIHPKKK